MKEAYQVGAILYHLILILIIAFSAYCGMKTIEDLVKKLFGLYKQNDSEKPSERK